MSSQNIHNQTLDLINNTLHLKAFYIDFQNQIDKFRLVGGVARDLILGKGIHDIDLATSFHPDELIALLKQKKIKFIDKNRKYGTILVIYDHKQLEITSLRQEIRCYGRDVDVIFCKDWFLDSQRRDLTINALYIDFKGHIYDYHNSLTDLQHNHLQFIGNSEQRIIEDNLRIMRLYRFALYYGHQTPIHNCQTIVFTRWNINIDSLDATKKLSYLLQNLSSTRISIELLKIIQCQDFTLLYHLFELLKNNLILDNIFQTKDYNYHFLFELGTYIKEQSTNIKQIQCFISWVNPSIFFALLLNNMIQEHDYHYKLLIEISKKEVKLMNNLVRNIYKAEMMHSLTTISTTELSVDHIKILSNLGAEDYKHHLLYNFTTYIHDYKDLKLEHICSFITLLTNYNIPKLPVNGHDILNLSPKKPQTIAKIIQHLNREWIEHSYNLSKSELMHLAQLYLNKIELDIKK